MAKKNVFSPASIDALKSGTVIDPLKPGLAIEVLGTGKKRRRYCHRVAGTYIVATLFGGLYPAQSITEDGVPRS